MRQVESPLKALFLLAFREELANWVQLLSQSALMFSFLVVFNWLCISASASGASLPGSPQEMLWYLVIGEVIVFSSQGVHSEIESDIRQGRMTAALLRPIHYLKLIYWKAAGSFCARVLTFSLTGCVTGLLLTGGLPGNIELFFLALLITPLACGVLTLFFVAVGLSAVWVHESRPVFWVVQKSLFVLGGLFLPIVMYPDWFQQIAALLPFKPILNGTAQAALGASFGALMFNLLLLALWGGVGLAFVLWLHSRFVRKVMQGDL
jgi:ABC-2 type transport system permease protein